MSMRTSKPSVLRTWVGACAVAIARDLSRAPSRFLRRAAPQAFANAASSCAAHFAFCAPSTKLASKLFLASA